MNDELTGGPAFPRPTSHLPNVETSWSQTGMTLRDWFAGQALSGMTANSAVAPASSEDWAHGAYELADAMIAERAK